MLSALQFLVQSQLLEVEVVDHELVSLRTSVVLVEPCLEFCADLSRSHFQRMLHNRKECLSADVTIEHELLGCLSDLATQDDGISGRCIGDKSEDVVPQLGRDTLQGGYSGSRRRHGV